MKAIYSLLVLLAGSTACRSAASSSPRAELTEESGLEEVSILAKGLE